MLGEGIKKAGSLSGEGPTRAYRRRDHGGGPFSSYLTEKGIGQGSRDFKPSKGFLRVKLVTVLLRKKERAIAKLGRVIWR